MASGHRETSMIASIVKAAGADLCVERRGDGPPLLMIAGGGGDGGAFTTLAGILAASHTVITYDRRGNSRSPLRAQGWEATFTIFQSRVGHVPPGQLPATMAVLLRPGTVLAPGRSGISCSG
jgi:pimeloyl-ACP methyl ester carboxylesterase